MTPTSPIIADSTTSSVPAFLLPAEPPSIPLDGGLLDHLPIQQVLSSLTLLRAWSALPASQLRRRLSGAEHLLIWLNEQPGDGWQARWRFCEAGRETLSWVNDLAVAKQRSAASLRGEVVYGLSGLLLGRLIRPSYGFLVDYYAVRLFTDVRTEISPERFEEAEAATRRLGMVGRQVAQTLTLLAKLVLYTGKELDQLTADDLLGYRAWNIGRYGRQTSGIHGAWDVLRDIGVLDVDESLRAALRTGQSPTRELVARFRLECDDVREVLIRYLDERRPGMDFSSFRQLVTTLAGTFWADMEAHHPGINSLDLPPEIAATWKERVAFTTKKGAAGRPRKGRLEILSRVRSFYLDIQEWAHQDPAQWAAWAVRCPIKRTELEGIAKRNRARTAEMHQRVRERLPHLLTLVDAAERHRDDQAALLMAAQQVSVGETFEHNETTFRRTAHKTANHRSETQRGPAAVLAENMETSEETNLLRAEEDAFWAWAIIETLRHTGIRIEELLELTHLALISYRLPDTKEIVPLLQIVPSKSNEERLLLVTPELASVLAAVISRVREADGRVPLTARYDAHERTTGPLLPHLFQRRVGWRREIISTKVVVRLLNDTLSRAKLEDRAGAPLRYTPHDFRRMFVTEAVTGGLPVHIAARILGHHSLSTTQAYLAVFQDDLIRSYRTFLDKRRASRPMAEYREPTDEEWDEFQKHFELRKVELGTCGRPYGTPCAHEHACIRCPMLRVDPAQRRRLEEIIRNLTDRIGEAQVNGWLGEVQGLQISLGAARSKLQSLNRLVRNRGHSPVDIGMPVIPGERR
ncbi:site-specific integrase [Nonomuraea sp. NPDC000554]|uniref:tyrosine-type recombinase/integrase n=1 Tax=Nonomuraea sp. NPDC000554 TaxID=3154259 RepID=UPI00332575C9